MTRTKKGKEQTVAKKVAIAKKVPSTYTDKVTVRIPHAGEFQIEVKVSFPSVWYESARKPTRAHLAKMLRTRLEGMLYQKIKYDPSDKMLNAFFAYIDTNWKRRVASFM